MMDGGTLFEELGFYYSARSTATISNCCRAEKLRDMETGPILVHVVTQKGKGYGRRSSADQVSRRGSSSMSPPGTGQAKPNARPIRNVFGASLVKEARRTTDRCPPTAAMAVGHGVDIFNKPSRIHLRRRHRSSMR